jgi:HEPN domain-containing protein
LDDQRGREREILSRFRQREHDYVIWQNAAFSYYLASRRLILDELQPSGCFNAVLALELMLKATLVYWIEAFHPEAHGHQFERLLNMVRSEVEDAKTLSVPEYFYFDKRYLLDARYPREGKGVGIPSTLLDDLDQVFCDLLVLVPFQFNSLLLRTLEFPVHASRCELLAAGNHQMDRIAAHVRPWAAYLIR